MNRTAWLQDRRMQKFRDVLSRWEARELSALEAAEILGMSERQFRRYRRRYEDDGLAGLIDRRLGWLNVRIQTWMPFTVHVVVNGREWLSRELCRQGIGFERRDNCFVDVQDTSRAQRIMDRQPKSDWPRLRMLMLTALAPKLTSATTGVGSRP